MKNTKNRKAIQKSLGLKTANHLSRINRMTQIIPNYTQHGLYLGLLIAKWTLTVLKQFYLQSNMTYGILCVCVFGGGLILQSANIYSRNATVKITVMEGCRSSGTGLLRRLETAQVQVCLGDWRLHRYRSA